LGIHLGAVFFYQINQLIVIDPTGGGNDQTSGRVMLVHKAF
jgi:hypothetical protein